MRRRRFVVPAVAAFLLWIAMGAQRTWAQAKDITGIWQGTLEAGKSLRLVLKVQKGDDGAYKAQFFSIDQGGAQIPVTSVKLDGSAVKLSIVAIGGSYEGKVLADGSEMEGTWSQGGNPLPLNLKHVTEATMWTIPAPPPKLAPMAKDANPAFEVATIKPTKPDEHNKYLTIQGTEFKTVNFSLADLIAFSYGVHAKQIVGAPAWVDAEKWDISGKPDTPGTPNVEQLKTMVKKLLVERFQLKFHDEKRVLSVYALEPGKTAPKLTKSDADAGSLPGLFFTGLGKLNVRNATMVNFCNLMQEAVLDRPVVDQTKLEGRWDFTLNWTPDESQFAGMGMKIPPPSDKADAPPPLFTAIQEQLGLKLEPTKTEVGVLAVDKVEQPSDN
jgi:uncharacterized protein (TIGR03435 family)